VFSPAELTAYNGKGKNPGYVSIRGVVYDLKSFSGRHYPNIVPTKALMKYAGIDATPLFPVQVSALCNGRDGSIDPAVQLDYTNTNYSSTTTTSSTTDVNAVYHDFRYFTNDSRPDWWYEQQYMLKHNYLKGRVGYTPQYVKTLGTTKQKSIAIINSRIYDLTAYIAGGRIPRYPIGVEPSGKPDSNFMDGSVVQIFQSLSGNDVTKYWDALAIDAELKQRMKTCLDNLFYVGDVDTRNSTQCLFAKYLLLAITILLVSVIGFKFLAALQFGKKNIPENLDKFVMCVVPAYTEDEDSLRRAMDSVARMRYDDKRKLLVVICDGMIIGQGNDRPTPRIVLDILGVPDTMDPEALSFESLGEGMKQHNMAKVYSGLYEVQGHIVPFMVIVKVGKPSEVQKYVFILFFCVQRH
jgi:chitin synthase